MNTPNGNEERPFPQELINELDEMEQTDEELQEEAKETTIRKEGTRHER